MGYQETQSSDARILALAGMQHGVVTRGQLVNLGLSPKAVKHRITRGHIHPVFRGVYAVGRPQLTQEGRWIAAVMSCGPAAVLSHESAAALWRIRKHRQGTIDVSIPGSVSRHRRGLRIHRRARLGKGDTAIRDGIPVTSVICTLVDLGCRLKPGQLEAAINEADKLDLTSPDLLRSTLESWSGTPGVAGLRSCLDRRTFVLIDSELERIFLPLIRRAGLDRPRTGCRVNGFKVDFYWPELGLVVETDGLRYHRTPAQQARDRTRDQAHTAAGLIPLRFTHSQIRYEAGRVVSTLAAVARRAARTAR